MGNDLKGLPLRWKFVAIEGPGGEILWKWEAWTQTGKLVASSTLYDSLTECELGARALGYVPPEQRS